MARGKHRTRARQDHHPDLIVGLGRSERLAELHQEAPILGVAGVDPVEGDPGDPALVQGLVLDVLFSHGWSSLSLAM